MRGFKYRWGHKPTTEDPGILGIFQRIIIVGLVNTISTAFLVLSRDSGSPNAALAFMGVPECLGRTLVSEALATLFFGLYLITGLDLIFSEFIFLLHVIHWLANYIPLPSLIMELTDPKLHPPIFDSPHTATSLAWLWGKGWHQILRRNFIWCGAYPASAISRKLGFGNKVQKIFGLFGSFLVSGLLHEYSKFVAFLGNRHLFLTIFWRCWFSLSHLLVWKK